MIEATRTSAKPKLLSSLAFGTTRTPTFLCDFPLLGARLYAGLFITGAGFDKLPTPDWMVDQVVQMNFPFEQFSATAACLTEAVGGILLMAGLFTRPTALALAIVMGFAVFNFQGRMPIVDYHIAQSFFWFFMVFLVIGGGRFSTDALIRTVMRRRPMTGVLAAFALFCVPLGIGGYYEVFVEPTPDVTDLEDAPVIESVSLAGTFNEWSLDATPMNRGDDGLWSATIELSSPGVVEFKLTANGSWEFNVGDDDQTTTELPIESAGDLNAQSNVRFVVPTPGRYRVVLNAETLVYSVVQAE